MKLFLVFGIVCTLYMLLYLYHCIRIKNRLGAFGAGAAAVVCAAACALLA